MRLNFHSYINVINNFIPSNFSLNSFCDALFSNINYGKTLAFDSTYRNKMINGRRELPSDINIALETEVGLINTGNFFYNIFLNNYKKRPELISLIPKLKKLVESFDEDDETKSTLSKVLKNGDLAYIFIFAAHQPNKETEPLINHDNDKLDIEAIKQHHSISDRIKLLEDENNKNLVVTKLKLNVASAKKELRDVQNTINSDISALINEKIIKLSKQCFPYDNKISYLLIQSPSKYNFFTPADICAGANYKGIILLDLAIRELTQPPVLIHSSNLFKNLSDRRIVGICKSYISFQKQTFFSFDKAKSYLQETQQIIIDRTRQSLSTEERLYGKVFDIHNEENKND